jgi:ribose/xylose/arabinose/galactoside ABC-type transport system permease subunit
MAGIAGVIFVSRVSTTRSDMGMGLELDVIAAVVLGVPPFSAASAPLREPCSVSR